jgi:hypothetical protein
MNFNDVELPTNRVFGFFFAGMFALAGGYLSYQEQRQYGGYSFIVAITLLIVTIAKPHFLLPLNKLWMKLGLLIGKAVNPLILGIIFFGIFTPVGIMMRIFGRDELRLKPKKRRSYWRKRKESDPNCDGFKNQF